MSPMLFTAVVAASLAVAVKSTTPQHFIGMAKCSALLGNASISVEECERRCGTGSCGYDYWEVVNAITTWVLPLLVLVFNVQFSNFRVQPSNSKRCWWTKLGEVVLSHSLVLFHVLGNPIGFIWGHIERLQAIRRTRERAGDETVAIICVTLHDFNREDIGNRLCEALRPPLQDLSPEQRVEYREECAKIRRACRYSAFLLAHTRISSTRRSAIAVIAYSVALFTSLESAMAQDQVPVHTPHTLALRVLYYWLITAVALSSALGAFPTEYTAWAALQPVIDIVGDGGEKLAPCMSLHGGSYGHWPDKKIDKESAPRLAVAMLSVWGAWTFSFIMSWITPTEGFGCRNFLEIGYVGGWILNFVVSYIVLQKAKRMWPWAILALDVTVAIPTILCLFLAWRGMHCPSLHFSLK